jgi:hypothetical protein
MLGLRWKDCSVSGIRGRRRRGAGRLVDNRISKTLIVISPSPLACRISTSAEKSHPLNSVAPPATILNDVLTFSVGGAFLKLHCLFAYNAAQETYQRAFIVVQMMSPGHSHRLISPSVPIERTVTFVGTEFPIS